MNSNNGSSVARILTEALPYIQKFRNCTIIVKYGGSAMVDPSLRNSFARDVVLLKLVGMHPVVVHGGGKRIDNMLERIGKATEFIDGIRVTDRETMDVVEMVLGGLINKEIVTLINQHGGRAIGLSGKDDSMILAEPSADGSHVGNVRKINPQIVTALSADGFIPVLAPIGLGPDGMSCNINADLVAGKLAETLRAEKLIMLTDQKGLLAADGELLRCPSLETVTGMMADKTISGGMLPKMKSVLSALEAGVKSVHLVDGREQHAVLVELFTDHGIGTLFSAGEAQHADHQ